VFLSGCVAEQGKLVGNVKWLVHSELLYRLTTPTYSSHPPGCSGTTGEQLADDCSSAPTMGEGGLTNIAV